MGKGHACVRLLGRWGFPLPCVVSVLQEEQLLSGEEVAPGSHRQLSCWCKDEGENPTCHTCHIIVYINVSICKGLMLLISPGCPGSRDSTLISI